MKTFPCLLLFLLAAVAGCRKSGAPAAFAPGEAAPALQKAFEGAAPETKSLAAEAGDSMRGKDYVKTLNSLDDLDERNDLTAEQRQIAARVRLTFMRQLAAAAAAGDASAADTLKAYRATK